MEHPEVEEISLGDLFESLVSEGRKVIRHRGYELVYCGDVETRTKGNRFVGIEYVSRHLTPKRLVKVTSASYAGERAVTVTTDHVCMVYGPDHMMEPCAACHMKVGDLVSVYGKDADAELVGTIVSIEDMGETDEWVYDVEVDDPVHAFYADDTLVHNSQFVTIRCITEAMREEFGLPEKLIDWPDDMKLKLWERMEGFVENDLNVFVQNLIRDKYHSENSQVLRYSLEYIADNGVYESKKHYGVRKILSEGPEIVDKIKYSGIELKKGNVPVAVKRFLSDIYAGVLRNDWTAEDFRAYLLAAYDEFRKLGVDDVAYWKGYNKEKESSGFLEMALGTTGIAKACTFYNQIIESMGIGKRYDQILVGDKVRFTYVKPTNRFGINVLAYKPDQWPKEFDGVFEVDYDVMWEKLVLGALKKFILATGFPECDPRNMNLMDIDDL